MLNLLAIALFKISSLTVAPEITVQPTTSTIVSEHGSGGWIGVAEHGSGGWIG